MFHRITNKITLLFVGLLSLMIIAHQAYADNTAKTAHYFRQIKQNPNELQMFLDQMPKGGDLHMHIDGAVYAENLLQYGVGQDFCVHPRSFQVYQNQDCARKWQLKHIITNPALRNQVINHWSMRGFPYPLKSRETHFFMGFAKFEPLVIANLVPSIAGIVNRAGREHILYEELMIDGKQLQVENNKGQSASDIGKEVSAQQDLSAWRRQLQQHGLSVLVSRASHNINQLHQQVRKRLQCGTNQAQPGCQVTRRYQYIALRDLPLSQFFAQLNVAFGVAKRNDNVVGINIVMPEDWHRALNDYTRQMQMIDFLHQQYPNVHITLHAGELTFGQVPPKYLRYHIRQAVNIAHAERIGHGVDIAYERHAKQLLKQMAQKQIDVEINLTSNRDVLGVTGKQHPLPLYLRYNVPVTLSTDDEGVERTDLTHELKHAILTYDLSYRTVKQLVRNSLTYSFLPGQNLWSKPQQDTPNAQPVAVCQNQVLGQSKPSKQCQQFLQHNLEAKLQWQLERQFRQFERVIAQRKSI